MRVYIDTYIHTHTYTHTHKHILKGRGHLSYYPRWEFCSEVSLFTHTHIHAYVYTYIHTYIHTYICMSACSWKVFVRF